MSWFNKRKTTTEVNEAKPSVHTIDPQMEKFEKIFSDNEEPVNVVKEEVSAQPVKTNVTAADSSKSPLSTFFNDDYEQLGYSDGYNFHSEKHLQFKIEELKGTCYYLLEAEIHKLQAEANNLTIQGTSYVSDDFTELKEQIDIRFGQVHQLINNLMTQKDLLSLETGLIQKPIAKYRAAYFKGTYHYQECEVLSKPLTIF